MGNQLGLGSIPKGMDSWWPRVPTSLLPSSLYLPFVESLIYPRASRGGLASEEVFLSWLVWRGTVGF